MKTDPIVTLTSTFHPTDLSEKRNKHQQFFSIKSTDLNYVGGPIQLTNQQKKT
jgi:hypothetical protein